MYPVVQLQTPLTAVLLSLWATRLQFLTQSLEVVFHCQPKLQTQLPLESVAPVEKLTAKQLTTVLALKQLVDRVFQTDPELHVQVPLIAAPVALAILLQFRVHEKVKEFQ
jgi:hypothetical protein